MATEVHRRNSEPPQRGFLRLPNEILIDIVSYIPATSDLSRLGRINRRLYLFIKDYIARYRYSRRLVALPDEIILKIGGHLWQNSWRYSSSGIRNDSLRTSRGVEDLSSLARASQRFHPLVMDRIILDNVQHGGSALLNHAAKKGLDRLARRVLHLGGDVNTRMKQGFDYSEWTVWTNGLPPPFNMPDGYQSPSPLGIAAYYGQGSMVRLFLEAGGSQFFEGMRLPLALAIAKRHEEIALMLSQHLDSDDVSPNCFRRWSTLLQMACEAKLVALVRHFLELPKRNPWDKSAHVLNDRSIALCRVLQVGTSMDDEFIKREIHDDVYEIASLLLKHGANPDFLCKATPTNPNNILQRWRHLGGPRRESKLRMKARDVAVRHPDPRVRLLVSQTVVREKPKSPWDIADELYHRDLALRDSGRRPTPTANRARTNPRGQPTVKDNAGSTDITKSSAREFWEKRPF